MTSFTTCANNLAENQVKLLPPIPAHRLYLFTPKRHHYPIANSNAPHLNPLTRLCKRPDCTLPFSGTNPQVHEKNYHSARHTITHDGHKMVIQRREDGKLPCPCGSEAHARYNFQKFTTLNRQVPHPDFDLSPYPDDLITHEPSVRADQPLPPDTAVQPVSPPSPANQPSAGTSGGRVNDIDMADSDQDPNDSRDSGIAHYGDHDHHTPVDPLTNSLQSPQDVLAYLSRFNITVEPTYLLTICTECCTPVSYINMRKHQYRQHFAKAFLPQENRLPSAATIEHLLVRLGAHEPKPIPDGGIPCPPGIKTVPGYKCSIPGCPQPVYGSERTLRAHWPRFHPMLSISDREWTDVSCFPLVTQRSEKTYVEVSSPSESVNAPDAMKYIQASADICDLRSHTQIFSVSTNARRKGAVFAQSRWDLAIDGINCRQVANTSSKA
ncbi:hypothetical protein F5880DRAFT_1512547, partial [Lentinula raphanica]